MIAVTYLPLFVTILFRGMPGIWKHRHRLLVIWWAEDALQTLPPPKDGTFSLVGDCSVKHKRGTQNPLTQKGRQSEHQPWFFGIRFALLIANWDVSRLPVAFRLLRPKSHRAYQPANVLVREMVGHVRPATWATWIVVEGDAAYGSKTT